MSRIKIKKFDHLFIKNVDNDKEKKYVYELLLPYYDDGYDHIITCIENGDHIVWVEGHRDENRSSEVREFVVYKGKVDSVEKKRQGNDVYTMVEIETETGWIHRRMTSLHFYGAMCKPIQY